MVASAQVLEGLLFQRRKARWALVQDGGGSTPVSVISLTAPRLNVLSSVERVALRLVENIGIALRVTALKEGATSPAWPEWLRLLLRLACADVSTYMPTLSPSSLHDAAAVAGAVGTPAVALPPSAFDINASKLLLDALGKDVPPAVMRDAITPYVTALATAAVGVKRVLDDGVRLLWAAAPSAVLSTKDSLWEYSVAQISGPRAHSPMLFPLQLWGSTNLSRPAGGKVAASAPDPERTKRMLHQCRDCVEAVLAALAALVRRCPADLLPAVWEPVHRVVMAVLGPPVDGGVFVDVAALPTPTILSCVRLRSKATPADTVATVAPYVPNSKVLSMLSALAHREWVHALGWPQPVMALLPGPEGTPAPSESPAVTAPDAGRGDAAALFLTACVEAVCAVGGSRLPHVADLVAALDAAVAGLGPVPADVLATAGLVEGDPAWAWVYPPKRHRFARLAVSLLMELHRHTVGTIAAACTGALLRRGCEFFAFFGAAEQASFAPSHIPTVGQTTLDRTMALDAVLLCLVVCQVVGVGTGVDSGLLRRVRGALCDLVPTQAGLLRHVVKDALNACSL